MTKTSKAFTFLRKSLKLPRSLRTTHRLNAFLRAAKLGSFSPRELESDVYSLKTIKRFIKDFIDDELVMHKLLIYKLTEEGERVYEMCLTHPEIQKYIIHEYHSSDLMSRPTISRIES